MIKHYALIAWRNMMRNKVLSLIKILGLAVGIATFILGIRYWQFEKNFDKYNSNFERIYRVQTHQKGNKAWVGAECCIPMERYLPKNFPEVESAAMYRKLAMYFSTKSNQVFFEDDGAYVGKDFIEIFDFTFLQGDKKTALDEPNSILLSEKTAEKIFPGISPIGEILLDEQKRELKVTGVYKNLPSDSYHKLDYLLPFGPYHEYSLNSWGDFSYHCYTLLKPGASKSELDEKIKYLRDEHIDHNKSLFFLHPLSEIHLRPYLSNEYVTVLYLTVITCLLILVLSAVNYMNLSTAYSSTRSKEIGVRKVNGGGPKNLRIQYLFESLGHSLLAFFVAILLAKLSMPAFSRIVDREIPLNYFSNPGLLIFILLSVIFIGFVSGIYPALIMSSFKPVVVLKGFNPFNKSGGKTYGLKTMVCIQFILSAILIASSVWVFKNVNYLKNKDLGFDRDNLLFCEIPNNNESTISFLDLKNRITSHAGIENMCVLKNPPMIENWGTSIVYEGQDAKDHSFARPNLTGKDFIETYKIPIKMGRNFHEDFTANKNTCLLNETAIRYSGWNGDPIGKWVNFWGQRYTVVGVIEDIIMSDVYNPVQPYILAPHDGNLANNNKYTFRVNPNKLSSSIEHIRSTFEEEFPGVVFEVYTYEDAIDDEAVTIWSSVRDTFGFFTIIAILIAGFGLFALILFSVQKHFKEIGVRKVQGAKLAQIYTFILKEFFILFLITSFCILPVPGILARFMPGAYKYTMQPWDYIFICLISLAVVLISGSYNAIKASRMNPVKALRYE